jgi:ATP-dependent DNA ligase
VILDGEVVAVEDQGRPSFQALHHQSAHTLVYYAFDLVHLDGGDLTAATSISTKSEPLIERPARLVPCLCLGKGVCFLASLS